MDEEPQPPIEVFVGSPGEMTAHRGAVRRALERLNDDEVFEGLRLKYRDWRDGSPGAGRPQEVVFKEMGRPDVFVGVFGHRIGSPTGRAPGGTVEEYEAANHLRRHTGDRPEILLYFQHVAAVPTRAEYEQLGAVVAFRDGVHERSEALAWDFADIEQLENDVRVHLRQAVRRLLRGDEERRARGMNYLDEPIQVDADRGQETFPDRDEPRMVNLVELRLKLEAKLTWLANHLFERFVTLGSLEYDGYLPRDHAKRLARLLAHDPSKVDDADRFELQSFARAVADDVENFRATTFDGYVRRSAAKTPGWKVVDFPQSGKNRPDFLLEGDDGTVIRVAPRLVITRTSRLLENTRARLARTRDQQPPAAGRVAVIPDMSPHPTTGAPEDPQVLKLAELLDALATGHPPVA